MTDKNQNPNTLEKIRVYLNESEYYTKYSMYGVMCEGGNVNLGKYTGIPYVCFIFTKSISNNIQNIVAELNSKYSSDEIAFKINEFESELN